MNAPNATAAAVEATPDGPAELVQRLLNQLQASVMNGKQTIKGALATACSMGIELGRKDSEASIKIVGPGRAMFDALGKIEHNVMNGKTPLARALHQALYQGLEMTDPEQPFFEVQIVNG